MCDSLPAETFSPKPKDGLSTVQGDQAIGRHCRIDAMWHANLTTDEWKLIERFAQEGLFKQEVWSSRLQWLGVKAKIEIPLSGTGFNVRQTTLRIDNLPESWPMDTESAWRERFCKVDFTFQDIVEHLQAESFTDDIFEGYENTKAFRWIAVFNEFWPQGHLDYADLWKGNTVPQLPPKSCGTKSHNSSWRISSSMRQAKANIGCH